MGKPPSPAPPVPFVRLQRRGGVRPATRRRAPHEADRQHDPDHRRYLGIGLGLALRLHEAANRVIVAGRRRELLDEITAEHPGIDAPNSRSPRTTSRSTKAALHSFSESLRMQLADSAVQVVEVAPPGVRTTLLGQQDREASMPLEDFLAETLDWVQASEPCNANGIVPSRDGRGVIVVHATLGKLYHVDLDTGHATEIALKGADDVIWGGGILLAGHRLYVVQNFLNRVSVFDIDARARTAVLRDTITDPRFEVPSAVAHFGDRLYLVDGRFDITPTLDTPYDAVAVELR
ncbi:hypothetical protein [Streptomyces sp. NPDC002588]|uniref:hypothetical protein n=1 Tax=Streptomyces sp. NPDC002588 TaxID=3154419 RepID=UPI00332B9BE5